MTVREVAMTVREVTMTVLLNINFFPIFPAITGRISSIKNGGGGVIDLMFIVIFLGEKRNIFYK